MLIGAARFSLQIYYNYLIDGITVADYTTGELALTPLPDPDSIEEFKVSTSLYDASLGRVETKSFWAREIGRVTCDNAIYQQ